MKRKKKSEKELVRELYLRSIVGKRTRVLRRNASPAEYVEWRRKIANHLFALGFSQRETTYIIQQAEDQANKEVYGKARPRKNN